MRFLLEREPTKYPKEGEAFTLGRLYDDNRYCCNTLEDEDRQLETGKAQVYGRSAIPRGTYQVVVSFSHKFGKVLPELLGVPGFSGIRIHGGNRAEDSLGCILVGQVRTANGIAQCANTVQRIICLIERDEANGIESYIEVR